MPTSPGYRRPCQMAQLGAQPGLDFIMPFCSADGNALAGIYGATD